MDNKKDILWRVYVLYGFVALFGLAVVAQIFKVQFAEGEKWRSKAETLTTAYHTIDAVRGNIYAEDGSLLATSLPIYEIRMDVNAESITDKIFNKQVDSLGVALAGLFKDKSAQQYTKELKRARKRGERYFLIRKNVRYTELKQLKRFPIIRMGRYKGGLIYIQQNKRELPFKNLAIRTLGYYRDSINPVGIEGSFNKYLRGVSGKRLMQKISGNEWMPINDENEIEPMDGADIITTIDVNIQDVAQAALYKQLVKSKAQHGCAVLMEVETGAIKAIANLTRKDSTTYVEDYNYALGESTYPGSTFKLASYMAAIDDGFVSYKDTVDIEGGKKQFVDRVIRDSHAKENRMTIQRAFEASSNVAVAKIIHKYYSKDPSRFTNKLKSFGLGTQLGLELPGEGVARVKTPEDKDWYSTTLPYLAHGYECLITPLQMLTFYNAVANNGKMVKPMFVKQIMRKGKVVKEFKTEVIKKSICKQSTLKQVRGMLDGVVENGTAKNLKNNYLRIAGKTGTAVLAGFAKNSEDYDNTKKKYQASFIGYFPAENPKYSIVIVINNPSHDSFYGNVVAGPIFREIADKVYSTSLEMHKDIEKDTAKSIQFVPFVKGGDADMTSDALSMLGIEHNQPNSQWVSATAIKNSVQLNNERFLDDKTPNVIGMCAKDALLVLERSGFNVKLRGKGQVVKQSIQPGTVVFKAKDITIYLS